MSERLDWLFKLGDDLSGPSRKMAAALKTFDDEIEKADKSLKQLEKEQRKVALAQKALAVTKTTDPVKRQRLELQLQRDKQKFELQAHREKLMLSRDATKDAAAENKKLGDTMGLAALKGGIWGAVITKGIDLALGLASAVARAGVSVAELGMGFIQAGLEAESFQRQMRLGFEVSTGSKSQADFEMRDARLLSEGLSTSDDATQKRYLSLLQGGFSGADTHVLLQAVEDMAAAGQGDKADNIVLAIKQIRAKGRLQAEELVSQLADAGLNIGTVYEKIGKIIGTDTKGAMKAISKGDVSSAIGVYAIVSTIKETFSKDGVIGATAKAMSDDTLKLLGKLEERPRLLMKGLEGNKGIKTLQGFLQNLLKATDPDQPTGKRIVSKLNELFDRILTGLFGDLAGESGMQKIEKVLDSVLNLVDRVVAGGRVMIGFFQGVGEGMGLDKFLGNMGTLLDQKLSEGDIQKAIENFHQLGTEFGKSAKSLTTLVEAIASLTDALASLAKYRWLFDWVLKPGGKVLGDTTTGGLFNKLGVASDLLKLVHPDTGAPPMQVTNPEKMKAGLRGFLPPQTSAAPGNMVELGGIHINMAPGDDAHAVAARLKELVPSVIADALERMAIEQGAM